VVVVRRRLTLAIVLALTLGSSTGRPESESEYRLKAAFLYNFARFVEWPPEALGPPHSPFVIAVLGQDPFGEVLDRTMAGKTVAGHPVEVRRVDDPDDAAKVHILFVSASERDRQEVIVRTASPNTLTVGDTSDFARAGGMIGFLVRDRRVRFEINPARAEQARLKLSSQLLKLATLVPPGKR
jgi:hypothetical protein